MFCWWLRAISARKSARRAFYLPFWLLCLSLPVFAKGGPAPKASPTPTARPVARLLSTSEMVVGNRARPRLSSAKRLNSSEFVAANAPAYLASYRPAVRPAAAATFAATSEERRAFDLVNAERASKGLRPFEWDGDLARVARQHAQNMARGGFLDHVGRDGLTPSARADAAGIRWRAIGENIAYNQGFDDAAAFAVERWMTSSQHRSNILSRMFTSTGLGVARGSDGRVYFTQVFIVR